MSSIHEFEDENGSLNYNTVDSVLFWVIVLFPTIILIIAALIGD